MGGACEKDFPELPGDRAAALEWPRKSRCWVCSRRMGLSPEAGRWPERTALFLLRLAEGVNGSWCPGQVAGTIGFLILSVTLRTSEGQDRVGRMWCAVSTQEMPASSSAGLFGFLRTREGCGREGALGSMPGAVQTPGSALAIRVH